MGSAYAEFQEKEKGSITPGKLADFVVLSDDVFKIPPAAIKNVKVEATYLGGSWCTAGWNSFFYIPSVARDRYCHQEPSNVSSDPDPKRKLK